MTSFLAGSLADQVTSALSAVFLDATLTRVTTTGSDPTQPGTPNPTTTAYACKAIEDTYSIIERAGGNVQEGDVKVLVLAQTLATVPQLTDTITTGGVERRIISFTRDPAGATWEIQARL